MDAYIGPAGALVPFKCPSSVDITPTRPTSYKETLGGRVKAQRGKQSRRAWSVGIGTATPAEAAGLLSLVEGGTPPWVWVEPYAMVTNLLSPEQSVLAAGTWAGSGVTVGGGATASDGKVAVRTVTHASGTNIDFGYRDGVKDWPVVVPGVPVTWSAYVRGSGQIAMQFVDWSGAAVGSTVTKAYVHADLRRTAVAATPPAGAAMCRVWVTNATQSAMPAFTWTPVAGDWSVGRGCNRVIVEGLSEAVMFASVEDPGFRRSSLSFTVREVG